MISHCKRQTKHNRITWIGIESAKQNGARMIVRKRANITKRTAILRSQSRKMLRNMN